LDIKDNKFNIGKIFTNNRVIKAAYWEHVNLRIVILEVGAKTAIEQKLVIEIIILLNIVSIAL